MKTKPLSAIAAVDRWDGWGSFSQKMFGVLLILALLLASLPMRVSAASASPDGTPVPPDLAREWSNKLRHLQAEGRFYTTVRLYPAEYENRDDLALAQDLLNKYGLVYRQANTLVINHTGFDARGRVTNEIQAADTLHQLGEYLKAMRGFKAKMAEINDEALHLGR
jgi:hypothetical protein